MINTIIGYIIIYAAAIIVIAAYFWKKDLKRTAKLIKWSGITLAVFFAVRLFWGRPAVSGMSGLQYGSALFDFTGVTLIWLGIFCSLAVVFCCFYDFRFLKFVNKFVIFPLSVLSSALYFVTAKSLVGGDAYQSFSVRLVVYAAELGLALGCSAVLFIRDIKLRPEKADALNLVKGVVPMVLACMPAYYIQVILGPADSVGKILDFTVAHRLLLYAAFIIPTVIYFIFKDKEAAVKKCVLMYVAFAGLISFTSQFYYKQFLSPVTMPLHLCNTALYIVPLCLLFNWRKLFYFTYFINVFGALAAMVFPNYAVETGITDFRLVSFFSSHYLAFFMPVLMVAFGVYPRPKWKEFKFSLTAFAVYFAAILFVNVWFSNYGSVDFFFINSDFIANKFGEFGKNIYKDYVWSFKAGGLTFEFHPLFQLLFFLVYVVFSFGMWFLYELGFQAVEKQRELFRRKTAIKFDELAFASRLKGRSLAEPVNKEGADMLRLINFSKKYGASKVFAVENANLEVKAGEIFGFLGPNGAGKSTIIKSIVGIQPPTSGSIEVCGYDVVRQDVEAKMLLGFVPDHYALYERLTGREYINYIADIYKIDRKDRDQRINALVTKFDLESAFDNAIKTYSHGMKQKIAIIAAIIHNPKVWVLDEPLTGLDPTSIHQVKETMKEYAEAGNIVFFSSHIIDVVERVCDRIAIIVKGQIKIITDLSELERNGENLENLYLETIGQKSRAEAVPVTAGN